MSNSSFEHMSCIYASVLAIMEQIVTSKITTIITGNSYTPPYFTPEIEINETELYCKQNITA